MTVVAAAAFLLLVQGSGKKYDKHLELAAQYLEDMEYEKAIAELRTAIDIDPKNGEAYLALADVYVEMGDYENAIAVLEEGVEEAGGAKLEKRLEALRAEYEQMQAGAQGDEDRTQRHNRGCNRNLRTAGTGGV